MAVKHIPTGISPMKIFFLIILSQLILLGTVVAQCPRGSTKEKTCASCARLPKARHFSDSCCTQQSSHDFCENCLKNLIPCIGELTDLLTRRAPIMKQENNFGLSETEKRRVADNGIQSSLKKRFYHNLFSKRVPEILVPAPPVDEQKRQANAMASK